ncbi:hypothetical protein HDV06_000481 [Boothiomyces sp. JEL0866]|nr:hypothetical protein HDV06_000481 [Boothiomyces sp. JEL0866]
MSDQLDIYFESDWISQSCAGPPDFMSTYSDSNPSEIYNYVQDQFSYPACGMDPVARLTGCCYSSLKKEETFGFQGISINLLTNSVTEQTSPPMSANGYTYCMLASNGTIMNTFSFYVLQSSECAFGFLCNEDSLSIHEHSNCTGTVNKFQLGKLSGAIYNSTEYGEFVGSITTVSDGQNAYSWEGLIPGNLVIPNHAYTLDKMALIGYILAIGGSIIAMIIYGKKLSYRQSTHNILGFSSQITWLFEHSQTMFLDYYLFPSQYSVLVYQAIFAFTNLASLLTVLVAIDLITKLYFCSHFIRKLAFGCTIFVHLAMVGWTYLAFLEIVNPDVFNLLNFNLGMLPVSWNIVMFVVDLFPPFIVMYKVFLSSLHLERKLERWQIEVVFLVIVHLLNTVSYGVVGYLASETEVFKNDRNLQNLWGINRFQFMLNCIIVLRFNVYLKMILDNGFNSSTGSEKLAKVSVSSATLKANSKSMAALRV